MVGPSEATYETHRARKRIRFICALEDLGFGSEGSESLASVTYDDKTTLPRCSLCGKYPTYASRYYI